MSNIRVLSAAKSLSNQWFPANPVVHELVTTKIKKGFYNKDIKPLFVDLMSDPALFGYCIRQLLQMAKTGEIPKPPPFNILALFEQAGTDRLKQIIDTKPETISAHQLEQMSEQQLSCLHQSIVSTATSELLSEKSKFPDGVGFTSAFLRQLGLTLIAWNYPHIFRQAVNSVTSGGEGLDQILQRILGYSPRLLGLTIARDWGFGDEFIYSLGDKKALAVSTDEKSEKVRAAAEVLSKLCEVGEILAQANHPDMYPEARSSWKEARKKVEHALGPQGFSLIDAKFKTYCQGYLLTQSEQLSKLVMAPVAVIGTPDVVKTSQSVVQRKIDDCPPELRVQLDLLYEQIVPGKPNREAVLNFANKVVPAGGFAGGCIFMYDFEARALIPRYRFGQITIPNQKVGCSALDSTTDPIAEAYRFDRPVIEYSPWGEGELKGYVAQAFGVIQRVGVFYLEVGGFEGAPKEEVLAVFDVLKRTLQDCLSVK